MTDNITPLVSIIAPMYNVERYIDQFVQCILDQTYTNWELILVDDGSTDNTLNALEKFNDPRISKIKRDRAPKGSVTCRNIGQSLAKGVYFIHFDSDDIVAPYCLDQRVGFMNSNPSIEYATFKGGTVIENEDGTTKELDKKWGVEVGSDDLSLFLSTKYPYSVWNNIYRKEAFGDYMWDENVLIYTDFSYIVPAIIAGKKHLYDKRSQEDYFYRMGQSNAMTQSFISDEKYNSTKYLFKKTLNSLESLEKSKLYKNAFYDFFRLQYFRLIMEGTGQQIDDFYTFIIETYNNRPNISVRLAYSLFNMLFKDGQKNNPRQRKLLAYLTLQPRSILKWLKLKIFEKKG